MSTHAYVSSLGSSQNRETSKIGSNSQITTMASVIARFITTRAHNNIQGADKM
uniref:Uncharacterized protein n=1 Tax=Arundo donax TaxID=35708 RepID=A0A0A9C2W4_ARUDO